MASLKADEIALHLAAEGFECPEGLVAVAINGDFVRLGELGLVILAMGDAYWTFTHGDAYVLCVNELRTQAILAELEAYALLDSRKVEPAAFRYSDFQFGWISFALYSLLLIVFFLLQKPFDLIALGRADSLAIIDLNQWWRALTALTLHADVVHLMSNLVAGMGFAFFVARFFGATAGWLLILMSGVAGNLLNAWVYFPEVHFSIGASTAVFGALGLLTGVGVCAALIEPQQRWTLPRWLVPIFGGLTLLGLIGVGDGLVDVAAHISGFASGFVLGLVGAFYQTVFQRLQRVHWLLVFVLFGTVGLAWFLALSVA